MTKDGKWRKIALAYIRNSPSYEIMRFQSKQKEQYNSHESALLDLCVSVHETIRPDCPEAANLRIYAREAFEELLNSDSDNADDHLRLLQARDRITTALKAYHTNASVSVQSEPMKLTLDVSKKESLQSVTASCERCLRLGRSFLVTRSAPLVFRGLGWGDRATIGVNAGKNGTLEFSYFEVLNDSRAEFSHLSAFAKTVEGRGYRIERHNSRLERMELIASGQEAKEHIQKLIPVSVRLHDFGGLEFRFTYTSQDSTVISELVSAVLQSIYESPRERILFERVGKFRYEGGDYSRTDLRMGARVGTLDFISNSYDRFSARNHVELTGELRFSELGLTEHFVAGGVAKADYRFGFVPEQDLQEFAGIVRCNGLKSIVFRQNKDSREWLTGERLPERLSAYICDCDFKIAESSSGF